MDGNLVLELKSKAESELRSAVENLKPEEAAVLALQRGRLAKAAEQPNSVYPKVLPASGGAPQRRATCHAEDREQGDVPPATSTSGNASKALR